MKIPYLSITTFLLAIVLFPFNTVLAQNEIQPQIWFDHASYGTKEMTCNPPDSTGIISEQGPDYSKATIIVTDPSANKYSTSIDRITVSIWSDSDKKGIEITAYETEVNSGIFKGIVTISEGQSTQDIIHVSDGDTISAKYAGTTPWSLDTANRGVTTTAFIGTTCPPLERVPASGIQITDNKGNEQKTILTDKQIQIGSNLTNVTIRNQTFAYVVQIQDKDGTIESLSWISGLLIPSQTFSPSISWTPSRAGDYTVNVFVWQNINNPNSLSPPLWTDLIVWPSLPDYTRSTIKNTNNFQCQSGYELVIKSSNDSPACVTPQTAQKLIERKWAVEYLHQTQAVTPFDNWLTMDVRYANGTYSKFGINYTITSGNKLLEARQDALVQDLVLSLQAKNNGTLIVTIPRVLLDVKMKGQDSQFIILEDGQEIDFKQIRTTITDRTLSITFQNDTSKIDIIAAQLI
ncbi:MAG: hypothetical protein KGH87_00875 [Thaumarchaeota archaeon]|nr:hypothetical protein [Nitrososphaerota archaeon]MDE1838448.1 hypothetical protein [Nitrososphaerota archaeon]